MEEIQKKKTKKRRNQTAWEKEWHELGKKEQRYIRSREKEREDSPVDKLREKVPEGLEKRMDDLFFKAFRLIFEKGTPLLEKTFNKEEINKQVQVDMFAATLLEDRRSLRAFSKRAAVSGSKNLLFCAGEGIGLGLAGVGLPDIPIFTGLILRNLYQLALFYGYRYDTPKERYFILLLIRGALSRGEDQKAVHEAVRDFIRTGEVPRFAGMDGEIKKTAEVLSAELLSLKFLQGIPLVGAVGGAYDAVCMNQILSYGRIMYRKRFLWDYKKDMERVGDVVEK